MDGLCPFPPLKKHPSAALGYSPRWSVGILSLQPPQRVGSVVFSFELLVLQVRMHRPFSVEGDDRLGRCLFTCNLKGDWKWMILNV